jgi:lipopolysaccharide/colanic/teichoic acid biosynthesis glycosyltransferase
VRPGLTGWAQINGRNAISWDEKFELDVEYIEKISIKLDTEIFFMTILKAFKREGVSAENHSTMEPFCGSK